MTAVVENFPVIKRSGACNPSEAARSTENECGEPFQHFESKLSVMGSIFWIAGVLTALVGLVVIVVSGNATFSDIANAFPADVLVILMTLDLFALYVVWTGALDAVGVRLALLTKGRPELAAILMGMLMFLSSAFLNNLAAVFILAPVFLSLLRAMRSPPQVSLAFMSLMLVLCNLGGMATPMGDFPAIMLMSSGLVGFTPYLAEAFPLAASLAMVVVLFYALIIKRQHTASVTAEDESRTRTALAFMHVSSRHVKPDLTRAALFTLVFAGMVVAWATIPPSKWPFFATALVGAGIATIIAGPNFCLKSISSYDLRTTVKMALILTLAALISVSGLVQSIAELLLAVVPSGLFLLLALMVVVTVTAGLFSAGPATAAFLPVFMTLNAGPLASYGDTLGIAFAASICAGSSMFLHSATSGPALRGEANKAGFIDQQGNEVMRDLAYLKYGSLTALMQLALSAAWVVSASHPLSAFLANAMPLGLLLILVGSVLQMFVSLRSKKITGIAKGCIGLGVVLTVGIVAFCTAHAAGWFW